MSNLYSKEEDQFILDNYETLTYVELSEKLHKIFGTIRDPQALGVHVRKRLGVKKVKTDYNYTEEEIIFLKEHAKDMSANKLAAKLYELYGRKHSKEAVKAYTRDVIGFNRENLKGLDPPSMPIGSETEYYTKGRKETYVKIQNTGSTKDDWILKQHYIWEKAHNKKVPDKYVIKFIDGDKDNFDPSNLICVSRSTAREICANNWDNGNPEFLRTIEKYGEMKDLLRKEKNNERSNDVR